MTFGEAVHQIGKGRVVARRSWPEFARNHGVAFRKNNTRECVVRFCWCGDGAWLGLWRPESQDEVANDWEVVDAWPPTAAAMA